MRMGTRLFVLLCVVLAATGLASEAGAKKKLPLESHACNDLITSSFKLENSMGPCATNGLRIGADNLTIDLNGKTIIGDLGLTDSGILNNGGVGDNLQLKNGFIKKFGIGVKIFQKSDAKVIGVHVAGSSAIGIELTFGVSGHVVKNSSVTGSGDVGIDVNNVGDVLITGTQVVANADGIVLGGSGADNDTITKSQIIGNRVHGIRVGNDEHTITKNTITGNGQGGTGGNGVFLQSQSSDNLVSKNVINGNGRHGVEDAGTGATGGDNTIENNTVNANGYYQGTSDGAGLGIDASAADTGFGSGNIAQNNDNESGCDPASYCDF